MSAERRVLSAHAAYLFARGRIRPTYLTDAAIEAGFVAGLAQRAVSRG